MVQSKVSVDAPVAQLELGLVRIDSIYISINFRIFSFSSKCLVPMPLLKLIGSLLS